MIHKVKLMKKNEVITDKVPLAPPTLSTYRSNESRQDGLTSTDSKPSTHS